jgi:hypothetical protein
LPSRAPKSQLELLGNHQQNHQLVAVDQAVQADLAADARKAAPADLVADPALVNSGPILDQSRQIGIFTKGILPLFF